MEYRATNECFVLHQDKSRTNCGKFVQTVKVIVYIELIILIGWLGYVSVSYYNADGNADCGVSEVGCKSSKSVYDNGEAKKSRSGRSVEAIDDGREMCERNANATRTNLDSIAARFVIGESSDPTVLQLRRNFTGMTVDVAMHVVTIILMFDGLYFDASKPEYIASLPENDWGELMKTMNEKFVNETDSQNRHRLKLRDPPIEEMANAFRDIAGSLFVDVRKCNMLFVKSFSSSLPNNDADEGARRRRRELKLVSQRTMDCRYAEGQLLTERRERLEAFAAEMKSSRHISSRTRNFMRLVESALIARNPSEVTVDDVFLYDETRMKEWKRFVSNASLGLKKEFYELVRDEYLEKRNANYDSPDSDMYLSYKNWTNGLRTPTERKSPRIALDLVIEYATVYNLRYLAAETKNSLRDSEEPSFGIFVNLDSESETLSGRRMRHILDGYVRLYFRVINRLGPCKPTAEGTPTGDRNSVKT